MTEPTSNSIGDWKAYLDQLVQEAAAAAGSGDAETMRAVQDKLLRFEQKSPPVADMLDEIALALVMRLHITNAEQRIKELEEVQERYRRIRKLIDGVAADNAS